MPKRARWTDEQLRDAVAASTTYAAVMRRLGLRGKGASHWTVKARIEELGLETRHFRVALRLDSVQLREATSSSTSYKEVLDRLGIRIDAATHTRIRRHIRSLKLDTSHFTRTVSSTRPRNRWTREQLVNAVSSSLSMANVLSKLGLVPAGGNYEVVHRHIDELGLDTSHFTGRGWNVGGKFRPRPALPLDQLLVANRFVTSHHLKTRMISEGRKPAHCELCGWAQRANDGRLPLELDHINGDRSDNRIENLRILCPNCHSLQPTHRGRNKRSFRARPMTATS